MRFGGPNGNRRLARPAARGGARAEAADECSATPGGRPLARQKRPSARERAGRRAPRRAVSWCVRREGLQRPEGSPKLQNSKVRQANAHWRLYNNQTRRLIDKTMFGSVINVMIRVPVTGGDAGASIGVVRNGKAD